MIYKQFPAQKRAISKKTEQWMKDCIDGGESLALYSSDTLRKSYRNKRINFDLYSDILDEDDIKQTIDPLGLDSGFTPAKMQNYPILNPKIDLLWGEENKRSFEWRWRTINEDAISDKETELNDQLSAIIAEEIQNKAFNEEDLAKRMKEFEKYKNFTYQDKRELMATWISRHLWEEQSMKMKLDKGFKDALISGEECYQWDIINTQPVLIKHNVLNVHTVRSGESNHIEDAEIIVIDSYYAPGKIIDEYNEYLTDKDIDLIEQKSLNGNGMNGSDSPDATMDRRDMVDNAVDTAVFETGLSNYATPFDDNGNVRVTKVYWKSMRKMQKVKYYDDQGDEQSKLMPEQYTIDKNKGEESKTLWINEWWEGHKIASGYSSEDGIYVKMQVRPIQFRRIENPSICSPGIVGTIYNTNDNVAVSLYDRGKPYQYMYNALMYNTELLISTNWGKIMKLDVSMVPDGWEVEKWISYAKLLKIAPVDSFKEGKKGAATGKLAGNMSSSNSSPVIDMEQGNTIQLYMGMMDHIKNELGQIVGISDARQGQISASAAVSNTNREVVQSSHTTEYYFAEHADVKRRVLMTGLETAKIAWADSKSKKLQFVTDDMITNMITIDNEDIRMIDFDLHVSNGRDTQELMDNLKQLAHAGIQTGAVNFSTLMDIWTTDSVSSIRRKLEASEEAKQVSDQKAQEQAQQMQTQALQEEAKEKDKDRQHDFDIANLEFNNTITLEQLKVQADGLSKGFDLDNDGIRDEVEIEKVRINNLAESIENEKARDFESKENKKDRDSKKELENIKSKNKPKIK